jgi:hypothetical protein
MKTRRSGNGSKLKCIKCGRVDLIKCAADEERRKRRRRRRRQLVSFEWLGERVRRVRTKVEIRK